MNPSAYLHHFQDESGDDLYRHGSLRHRLQNIQAYFSSRRANQLDHVEPAHGRPPTLRRFSEQFMSGLHHARRHLRSFVRPTHVEQNGTTHFYSHEPEPSPPPMPVNGHTFSDVNMGVLYEEESDESPPYLPSARLRPSAPPPTEEQYHQTVIDHSV